jgi:hypothetical protein
MVVGILWKAIPVRFIEKFSEIRFTKLFCFMGIAKKSVVGLVVF